MIKEEYEKLDWIKVKSIAPQPWESGFYIYNAIKASFEKAGIKIGLRKEYD